MRCQTDERLVDLVRAGNDRAFEAIVVRYRRPLVRYCSRLLPVARAEDAVQQAFMNAHAALHRSQARIELRPWLYRIAHNAALNALRESGWAHEALEAAAHRAVLESAHESAERRANLRSVLAAVDGLPERQRSAIILRELEGRSYEQIAAELGATGGAVRQLLNRARHSVRATATALTPAGLLARLPWGHSAPVLDRVTEAATHDGLRVGAARLGGALVASVAVATGLSEGTRHLPRGAPEPEPAALAQRAPGGERSSSVRGQSGAVVRLPVAGDDLPRFTTAAPRAAPRPVPAAPVAGLPVLPASSGSFAPRAAPVAPTAAPPPGPPGPPAHAAERDGDDDGRGGGDEDRGEDGSRGDGERRRDRGRGDDRDRDRGQDGDRDRHRGRGGDRDRHRGRGDDRDRDRGRGDDRDRDRGRGGDRDRDRGEDGSESAPRGDEDHAGSSRPERGSAGSGDHSERGGDRDRDRDRGERRERD